MAKDPRPRLLPAAFVVATIGAWLTACSHNNSSTSDRVCNAAQAISDMRYRGSDLPPKTLALTFDDGPGARTLELSHWLRDQGIRAGFFVNGRMLTDGVAILGEIVADGHVIGNHTQTHADLTTLTAAQIVAELEQTDELIAPFLPDGRFLFRPPFGAYTEKTFAIIESSPMKKYVGPVDWDIGSQMGPSQAADWDCWSPNGASTPAVLDVKTCGDLYLAEIHAVSRGIVLMHDPYFIDNDPLKGGTVDMVKTIVPILVAEGFTFVRVDEVPSIATVVPPPSAPPAKPDMARQPTPASTGGSAEPGVKETRSSTPEPCPPSP
jgi:peptidoglycan/xylan/chitin deacetylase (PgdA/CDA1 family)